MTTEEETVRRLYECLNAGDAAGAAECYCDDATFHDIAFDLQGKDDIAAMWGLVCNQLKEFWYRDIHTEGEVVKGRWYCRYEFSATGNEVRNSIQSTFRFHDGLILSHIDEASRWDWAKQAFGPLLGLPMAALPFITRFLAKRKLRQYKRKHSPG